MRDLDHPRYKTLNRWRSVGSHIQDAAGSVSLPLLPLKEVNTSVMTICNQLPLRSPKRQDQKLLMLSGCSFPGWGKERVSPFFDYNGGQYIKKELGCTIVSIFQSTVRYLNATIHRFTWNAAPEIEPEQSRQTWQNLLLDGYRSGFGHRKSSGSGLWTGLPPNWPIFPVQTQTAGWLAGPVAPITHAISWCNKTCDCYTNVYNW